MDAGLEGNNQGTRKPTHLVGRRAALFVHVSPERAARAARLQPLIYFAVVSRIQSETSCNAAGLNVSSIWRYSVGDPVWHVWNR